MRNGSCAIALTFLGTLVLGSALAQPTGPGASDDRGYPATATAGASGGSSSAAFAGVGDGSAEAAAQERGRRSTTDATPASTSEASGQKFKSPEAAVKAFTDALRAADNARLQAIFGPQADTLLSSGDPVADRNERQTFLRHFDRQHALNTMDDGMITLVVGDSAWPFAVPIAKGKGGYYFDSVVGAKQVVFRRIGRNERNAVAVCNGFVSAQKEYARSGHDGLPPGLFAQKLRSDPGKQNGLFWPEDQGGRSPVGPLLAGAAGQGYSEDAGKATPYHGYLYRPLTGQGDSARQGARAYVDDGGKQGGGFAMIAYPAEYGRTGVKSFIVNQDGIVYEQDLGDKTEEVARSMTLFEPRGWRVAL